MGLSAEGSFADDRLRLHSAPNVFFLGSGAFPTCSPANPSLTISALALRASEAVP
ncbi:GMC oxidoreductase [Ruegeria sp. Ofav3-42]|uniref:GMC oxidoreductase n=1 Tax=Ruegeria sp. Ofav3-42 TaxID=2917759 RepID=UPI001EF47BEC|nr:GMC oxidoreductase [Ruegeria sp. Ofav3-42]MCG7519778.1 GMC oxidoreductase [Ruegeria sp. Ofav3-42]